MVGHGRRRLAHPGTGETEKIVFARGRRFWSTKETIRHRESIRTHRQDKSPPKLMTLPRNGEIERESERNRDRESGITGFFFCFLWKKQINLSIELIVHDEWQINCSQFLLALCVCYYHIISSKLMALANSQAGMNKWRQMLYARDLDRTTERWIGSTVQ